MVGKGPFYYLTCELSPMLKLQGPLYESDKPPAEAWPQLPLHQPIHKPFPQPLPGPDFTLAVEQVQATLGQEEEDAAKREDVGTKAVFFPETQHLRKEDKNKEN